jgi:hypothetical protein
MTWSPQVHPIASKFQKLDGEKFGSGKGGVVQPSTQIHMVQKVEGTAEISSASTLVTEPDIYPQPNMLDFVADRAAVFYAIYSVPHVQTREW